MLFEALNFIVQQLDGYLLRLDRPTYRPFLGNIALQDGQNGTDEQDVDDKLVVSLISIEEEKTLKNETSYRRVGREVVKQNPPIFLNLHVLFSSNIADYQEALRALSLVIQFFQLRTTFSAEQHAALRTAGIEKLNFEIVDLSFEQTYNLWGVLGSKLVPNILYKVRVVAIQGAPVQEAGMVSEIVVTDKSIIQE
ncbi:MAG: DUF4255 domain-containing protein [Bacteroidota bacterium]